MWNDGERLRVFSSLERGETVEVEMLDGSLVEGTFHSVRGDCLLLDLGLYDRLLLTEEVERVVVVGKAVDPEDA